VGTESANRDFSRGALTSKTRTTPSTLTPASCDPFESSPSPDENRDKFEAHSVYIENNDYCMRRSTMRLRGLPIGSGVTESACKTMVNMRVANINNPVSAA